MPYYLVLSVHVLMITCKYSSKYTELLLSHPKLEEMQTSVSWIY